MRDTHTCLHTDSRGERHSPLSLSHTHTHKCFFDFHNECLYMFVIRTDQTLTDKDDVNHGASECCFFFLVNKAKPRLLSQTKTYSHASSPPWIGTSNRFRLEHFETRQAPLKFSPHLVLLSCPDDCGHWGRCRGECACFARVYVSSRIPRNTRSQNVPPEHCRISH